MLRYLLTLSLLCLSVQLVQAEQRLDLYSTDILVANQTLAERNTAVREALGQLVVRVSGDREALTHDAVRQAISQAQSYLLEFSYAATNEQLERDGELIPARRLLLKFSPVAIEELLRNASLPLWPANRPTVLVWLVINESSGVLLVSDADEREALQRQARLRGVPLIAPLMDLQDRLAVSGRDLWELNEEVIRHASARYGADAILVGRYTETSGGAWRSSWQLYHGLGNQNYDTQADSLKDILADGIDQAADHFADLYAIVPTEGGPDAIVLQVSAIQDFADYKQMQRYLSGLAMVRRVELVAVREDSLLLNLYAEGSLERLVTTLSQGGRLSEPAGSQGGIRLPENRYLPQGTFSNPLTYTWQ